MSLASGHSVETLDDEQQQQYNKDLSGCWNNVIRLQPGNWIVHKNFLKLHDELYNFKVG